MGKKITPEERRRRAEERGFNDDDTAINDKPTPRAVLTYTKESYDVQTALWTEYFNLSDHSTVREANTCYRYLQTHPDATPYNQKTLYHFADFIAKSVKGIINVDGKPSYDTIRNNFRRFVSGWNIDHPDAKIPRDLTDSVTNVSKLFYQT